MSFMDENSKVKNDFDSQQEPLQDSDSFEDTYIIEESIDETPAEAEQTTDNGSLALPALLENGAGLGGKISSRGLAEGAMMAALALILAVVSIYIPVLQLITMLLFPVPLALIVLRHGLKLGCLCAASVLLLSAMMLGLPHALFLFIQFGFLGLFFGWCFRQKKSATFTLFIGIMISSASVMLILLFPTMIAGVTLEQYQAALSTMLNEYARLVQEQGIADVVLSGMTPAAFVSYMEAALLRLLPGVLIGSAMFVTMVCYMVMGKVLRRFGFDIPKLPVFSEWRMDWRFLWILIVALALAGLGNRFGLDMMGRIGDNMLTAFSYVLFVCGASVAVWLLRDWQVATFIKLLVVLFIAQIFGGFMPIMVLAGVFDPLVDFRRRIMRLQEKRR